MRTIIGITLVSVLCMSAITIIAGNVFNIEPPAVVVSKINQLYPRATSIQWEMEKENFEAEFLLDGREVEILFSPSGTVIAEDKEVLVSELPESVMRSFNKEYSRFKITQAFLLWTNEHVQYKLIASSVKDRIHLWIDDSGTIESRKVFSREKKSNVKVANSAGLTAIEDKWNLPPVLREVSGITMLNSNLLACVQDEIGTVYFYDLARKQIVDSINFGGPGDYEGITNVNNDLYVLRSDGQLTCISDYLSTRKVSVHYLKLPQGFQNFEGLCLDKKNNRLLIAPRAFDSADRMAKNIYAFDIATQTFLMKPVYTIKLNDKIFNSIITKKEAMIPSEIFVHPVSGKIFLADARNKYVLISDPLGNPTKILPLDAALFAKTEGITMDNEGMFFLSNEGKTGPATLIKISPDKFD